MKTPGQGIAALEMLNILEGFDLAALNPLGSERIHLEARKLAFRDLHEKVGDPAFVPIPTERMLSNLIDHQMSAQEAVDHPRRCHDADVPVVEGRVPPAEVQNLRDIGHRVEVGEDYAVPTGGAQLIRVYENGVKACGSDPRKDGCALAR